MEVEGWRIKSDQTMLEDATSSTAGKAALMHNQIYLKLEQQKRHPTGVSTLAHSLQRHPGPDNGSAERRKSRRANKDLPISVKQTAQMARRRTSTKKQENRRPNKKGAKSVTKLQKLEQLKARPNRSTERSREPSPDKEDLLVAVFDSQPRSVDT